MVRNLIILKAARGLTATAIAQRCGLSISTVCRVQAGKSVPTAATAQKIAVVLGVDSEWLFGLEKENLDD